MALTLSSPAAVLLRRSNSELPARSPPKSPSSSTQHHSNSTSLSFHPLRTAFPFIVAAKQSRPRVSASHDSLSPVTSPPTESQSVLNGSTRTVTTVVTLAVAVSRVFLNSIQTAIGSSLLPDPAQLAAIRALTSNSVHSAGPLFFARSTLTTPLTVVAAGLARWLDIYGGILMVRVLLSWFPNVPWDRQPLSAIRDLCDPYLGLFRNVIPPVFDTLDVSPLLAFMVLGMLASILKTSVRAVL